MGAHGWRSFPDILTPSQSDVSTNKADVFFSNQFEEFAKSSLVQWKNTVMDWVVLGKVLVIHYEKVLENPIKEIRKIMLFLDMKADKRRLECLKYTSLDLFRRKKEPLPRSPYPSDLNDMFERTIEDVDKLLVHHGH